MEEESWEGTLGRRIMEGGSWKGTLGGGIIPGSSQEAPRKLPGGSQEAPRRLPGGSQEAPRRLPGSSQEAPRAPRRHQEALGGLEAKIDTPLSKNAKVPLKCQFYDVFLRVTSILTGKTQ